MSSSSAVRSSSALAAGALMALKAVARCGGPLPGAHLRRSRFHLSTSAKERSCQVGQGLSKRPCRQVTAQQVAGAHRINGTGGRSALGQRHRMHGGAGGGQVQVLQAPMRAAYLWRGGAAAVPPQ